MNALDRAIAYFSPKAALKRQIYRKQLSRSDTYAAAKSNRLTGNWAAANTSINDIIGASAYDVRARVRQLVRDFPYFGRAVNILQEYTVGSGIKPQARVRLPDGQLNVELNQQIEKLWKQWTEQADISGKLSLYDMMGLAKRQDVESGEFLLIKRRAVSRNRLLPLAYQIIESDWLYDGATSGGNLEIEQGIEYNKLTGEVIAYHFQDPDGYGKTQRVLAENVIHGFQTLRPGQLRGISPLVSGVLLSRDLSEFVDAELSGAKMAARWLAFVQTPDPEMRQLGLAVEDSQRIEDIENAMIEYLQPGESVNFASSNRPSDSFPPFVKLILTMFSVTTGAPYELISGDYQGLNYSTARTVRMDFYHSLKPIINRHVHQFCLPIYKSFMEAAVMSGALPIRDFYSRPFDYLAVDWQQPGIDYVDPLKEAKADIDRIDKNLISPQKLAAKQGWDLEELYAEIAEAKRLKDFYGLKDEDVSTADQNNPAAITEDQDNE